MSGYSRQQLVDFQEVGIGSAAATLLFLIIAFITALTLTLGKVRLSEETPR
jgi:trehalose/maltose transport system permease protein